jgi:iron complex outermembrane receptor protein
MFQRKRINAAVLLALGSALSGAAFAQETLERVQVTGSSIKRLVDTDAILPISVISAAELRASGVNSAEGALTRIAASQSMQGSSQSIGSGTGGAAYANMRGLGANKTLVLLNGRRVAAFAFDSSAVDLNSIPFAAVERVEVLRDGASAIYGTDAIGGVINFITKKDYKGFDATVNYSQPQEDGGKKQGLAVSGGFGSLEKDGFNIWASLDVQKNDLISSQQREFGKTGVLPDKGVFLTSGTTFPGNFSQGSLSGNPSLPGCNPPLSLNIVGAAAKTCRFDYTGYIDLVPETETKSGTIKGTLKLGGAYVTLEHMQAENYNLTHVAPDPVTGLEVPITNPFFPKSYPGVDATQSVFAGWRMMEGGQRTGESNTKAQRTVLSVDGSFGNWDYRAGLLSAQSKGDQGITQGYINKSIIRKGINDGILNPFGKNSEAGLAIIEQSQMRGVYSKAKGEVTSIDGNISTSFGNLAGGPIGVSFGAEYREETYKNDTDDDIVNNVGSLGASPYHVKGDRTIGALSAEFMFPVLKSLELSLAGRYDDYSDFGGTFNPKVGFRWTPMKSVSLRGSYNTGFRAPSLDEIYGPNTITYSANAYNDPLLCPGGVVAAGGVESRDCDQQVQMQRGGNKNLKPEESKTFSLGLAFEPVKNLTASIDYWNIELTEQIGQFPEQAIFADPAKHADRFKRCNALSADVQSTLDRCQKPWVGSNALGYAVGPGDNLGGVKTDGVDFALGYGMDSGFGRWQFSWEATWVNSYKYQRNKGDAFVENAGRYIDSGPVIEWVHNFGIGWKMGDFSSNFNILRKDGYVDENNVDPEFLNNVKAYTLADLSVTWTGVKHLKLTGGVQNLFDEAPPFSNQGSTFQKGYDPRIANPYGRTYFVRAGVSF